MFNHFFVLGSSSPPPPPPLRGGAIPRLHILKKELGVHVNLKSVAIDSTVPIGDKENVDGVLVDVGDGACIANGIVNDSTDWNLDVESGTKATLDVLPNCIVDRLPVLSCLFQVYDGIGQDIVVLVAVVGRVVHAEWKDSCCPTGFEEWA